MGTENVLTCVNATPSVQRVVLTSSTAAVFTDGTERGPGYVFTEADWNVTATPQKFPYFYSKKMAELVSAAAAGNMHAVLLHGAYDWFAGMFGQLAVGAIHTCWGDTHAYLSSCLLGCPPLHSHWCFASCPKLDSPHPVCCGAVSFSCSVQWRCARKLAAGGSW
jgi:hypothetical protein